MSTYLTVPLGGVAPAFRPGETDTVVVVTAPGEEAGDEAVAALVASVTGPDVVAVSVRPVTDTLKLVTERQVVVGTADREHHRFVGAPFALRLSLLRSIAPPSTATEALISLTARARLVPVESFS